LYPLTVSRYPLAGFQYALVELGSGGPLPTSAWWPSMTTDR